MKPLLKLILLLIIPISFTACKGSDDDDDTSQPIILTDSSATTGKLIVNVKDTLNNNLTNFEVKIFIDKSDFENDLYLLRLPTNSSGTANFGFINYGNYYIKAQGVKSGVLYTGSDVVQVRAEKTVTKTVIARK